MIATFDNEVYPPEIDLEIVEPCRNYAKYPKEKVASHFASMTAVQTRRLIGVLQTALAKFPPRKTRSKGGKKKA